MIKCGPDLEKGAQALSSLRRKEKGAQALSSLRKKEGSKEGSKEGRKENTHFKHN